MKRDPQAYAAILVLATIWGYNWVVIKIATQDADAFSVAAIRSAVGTICLFGALVATRRSLRPPPFIPTLILGALQTTVFTVLQVAAISVGGAGKSAVLTYTMPFWIVPIAWFVLHERVSRSAALALALAAAGLLLVLMPFDASGLTGKTLAVSGAIVWAVSAVYGKALRAKYPVDLLSLVTWQMAYGTLPLVAVAVLAPHHVRTTSAFLLSIGYVALLGTALAWLLWMFLLGRLSAGVAGIATLLTPVVGVIAAWLQLGERPGPAETIGLGCIVAALCVNVLPARAGVPQRAAAK